MFLHLSVILCTGRKVCREGGVVDSPRPGGRHAPHRPRGRQPPPHKPRIRHPTPHKPRGRHPPPKDKEADTPPQTKMQTHSPWGQRQTPPRNDPEADTPSSPVEAATEAGGTHPTGMHSC